MTTTNWIFILLGALFAHGFTVWVLAIRNKRQIKSMVKVLEVHKSYLEDIDTIADELNLAKQQVVVLQQYINQIKPLLEEINKQLDNVNRLDGCVVVDETYIPKDMVANFKRNDVRNKNAA
jgi:hypothetical protein